jgi:hypothetical protein
VRQDGRVVFAAHPRGSLDKVDLEPTIEQAAEQLGMRSLTAQEIADHNHQTVEFVMTAAAESATREGRALDDVLCEWFRALEL